ncbi:hypothetical protein DB346_13145 [Verrucomicrobia bacterium LW23]|nr:hypothetical protein DB346_13145 [Verrucomicrobia bacterium LW23]
MRGVAGLDNEGLDFGVDGGGGLVGQALGEALAQVGGLQHHGVEAVAHGVHQFGKQFVHRAILHDVVRCEASG